MQHRELVGGASWSGELRLEFPDGNDRIIHEPERVLWHEFRKLAMNLEPGRRINVMDINRGETIAPDLAREIGSPEYRVENTVRYGRAIQIDQITQHWGREGIVQKRGEVAASITNFGRIVLPTMIPVQPGGV